MPVLALRVRLGSETDTEVASASNPLTIASWGAIFAAASTARFTAETSDTVLLLIGIGVGSMAWFCLLSLGMRLLGRRIGDPGLRLADAAAGLGMVGYGGLLGLRTLHES